MKKAILALCIFHSTFLFAQTGDFGCRLPQEFSLASPDVMALGKYGMQPPDLSKGLPNISIPLYTIEEKGISFPISLNYNYSGYRPREETSWVGLGWTISSDAVITRIVRGAPDNAKHLIKSYDEFGYSNRDSMIEGQDYFYDDYYKRFNLTANRLNKGYYDGQPDMYIYNFNGYSGRFIYVNDSAICFPKNDILIKKSNEDNFIVSTPDGMRYLFEHSDVSDGWSYTQMSIPYNFEVKVHHVTSWRLKRIDNCFSKSWIEFNYTDYSVSERAPLIDLNAKTFYSSDTSPYGLEAPLHNESPMVNYGCLNISSQYLESIESNHALIKFIPADRLDYPENKSLREIKVFNKDDTTKHVKRYVLRNDGYFGNTNDEQTCVLKLSKLEEFGSLDVSSKEYSFEYNDMVVRNKKLTCALDHWGYYNGQNANVNLIPKTSDVEFRENEAFSGGHIGSYFDDWANRSPDFSFALGGALGKIIYPTGGSTEFFYESAGGRGIRLDSIRDFDGKQNITKHYSYYPDEPIRVPDYKTYYSEDLMYIYGNMDSEAVCSKCNSSQTLHARRYFTVTGSAKTTFKYVDENTNFYSEVTETVGNEENNGKIIYNFVRLSDDPSQKTFLKKTSYYKREHDNPFKIIENFYFTSVQDTFYYWAQPVEQFRGTLVNCEIMPYAGACGYFPPSDPLNNNNYLGVYYNILNELHQYNCKLDKNIETIDGVVTTTDYSYHTNSFAHSFPIKETQEINEKVITTNYVYPSDPGSGAPQELWDKTNVDYKHMLSPVVDKTVMVNGIAVSKTHTAYVYNSDKDMVLTDHVDIYPRGTEIEYTVSYEYDDKGNLIKEKKKDGTYTYYIWAYNKQYPVAKIESNLNTAFSVLVEDSRLSKSDNLTNIQRDVAYLKGLLSNYDIPDIMISYYTYKPLVGMTSQTDANGKTTYYKYDNFGRLEMIKDNDGKIVHRYRYHYKN